jgi:hypothetical protein
MSDPTVARLQETLRITEMKIRNLENLNYRTQIEDRTLTTHRNYKRMLEVAIELQEEAKAVA